MPKPQMLRIEYMPLGKLKAWPRNPRTHATDKLEASFKQHGFINPVIIDERTKRIVAGHGRDETLSAMKERGEPAPANIVVQGDEWLVPVLRGVRFKTDADAEQYLIADNKQGELGGYDDALLAQMLNDLRTSNPELNIAALGMTEIDISTLIDTHIGFSAPEVQLPVLPSGAQGDGRVICFSLTEKQKKIVDRALEQAQLEPFGNTGNINKNGNALARICEAYIGRGKKSPR